MPFLVYFLIVPKPPKEIYTRGPIADKTLQKSLSYRGLVSDVMFGLESSNVVTTTAMYTALLATVLIGTD